MQKSGLRALSLSSIVLGLVSCGVNSLQHDLRLANESKFTAFNGSLSSGYVALADRLETSDDFTEELAFHLNRKAIFSRNQKYVLPANVTEGALNEKQATRLSQERSSLMAYLDGNAREVCPKTAASAQVFFDCVVLLSSSAQDYKWCRENFAVSMGALERSC